MFFIAYNKGRKFKTLYLYINLPRKLRCLSASQMNLLLVFFKTGGDVNPAGVSRLREIRLRIGQSAYALLVALRQCYPEVSLFRALSLPDRTV